MRNSEQLKPKMKDLELTQTNYATSSKKKRHISQKQLTGSGDDKNNESIYKYIDLMYRRQKKYEQENKYRAASRCKTQIIRMKDQIQNQNISKLKTKQLKQLKIIKAAHQEEIKQMKKVWKKIQNNYNKKTDQMIKKWIQKQEKQSRQFREIIVNLDNQHIIKSKNLIILNKTKRKLAHEENYSQAERIYTQIKQEEKNLESKKKIALSSKKKIISQNIKNKHIKQYNALIQRITSGKTDQQILRKNHQQKISLKYQIILKNLQKQHAVQIKNIIKNFNLVNLSKLSVENVKWIFQHLNPSG